eukprot:5782772-Ditylum_brightwellii.AAC.1
MAPIKRAKEDGGVHPCIKALVPTLANIGGMLVLLMVMQWHLLECDNDSDYDYLGVWTFEM